MVRERDGGDWRIAAVVGFVAVWTLAAAGTVSAATYYVNDDALGGEGSACTAVGDNANDGLTPGTPKRDIQAARARLAGGEAVLVDEAPCLYQEVGARRVEVAGAFGLREGTLYGFHVGAGYGPARPLVIDPEMAWSTYLGGSDRDTAAGIASIAVDGSGNAFVTGGTESSGWVSGGFDTTHNGGCDAFVAKLSASGAHLWSTYLGGSAKDVGYGIVVDGSGNAFVSGETASSGWVSGGFDTTYNGLGDAFVAKLSPAGEHLWSTYLGGSDWDVGDGIAVDGSGNAFVTGVTQSSSWVSGGSDTTYNGCEDAFVAKISTTAPARQHGVADVGGKWRKVTFGTPFTRVPVVVAGPASCNDPDPGVVRIKKVTRKSFKIRFQEWGYLSGKHKREKVPWVAVGRGVWTVGPGENVVAGRFRTGCKNVKKPKNVKFGHTFGDVPAVLAQVQTCSDGAAVTDRICNVTRKGMAVAMQVQENGRLHGKETVGYIAVSPGVTAIGSVDCDAGVSGYKAGHKGWQLATSLGDSKVFAEEEKSKDSEVKHKRERVGYLGLGGKPPFVADLQTAREADPAVLRCCGKTAVASLCPEEVGPSEFK